MTSSTPAKLFRHSRALLSGIQFFQRNGKSEPLDSGLNHAGMTASGMKSRTLRVLRAFAVQAFGLLFLAAFGVILTGQVVWSADTGGRVPFPKPDSHMGNWVENHGTAAQLDMNEPGTTGKSCLTCHERNDCITCHNTRPPRDHTNFWRTRGHGFTAEVNRERCLLCHRQDYCVRCHNETAPRSHVATWRATHCGLCHFASGLRPADSCGVCHRVAPHTSAPTPHPAIGAQTDCSLCHR
jgi:hypothetical protein